MPESVTAAMLRGVSDAATSLSPGVLARVRAEAELALSDLLVDLEREDRRAGGGLLPAGDALHSAVTAVLMRLLVAAFAEDRELIPAEPMEYELFRRDGGHLLGGAAGQALPLSDAALVRARDRLRSVDGERLSFRDLGVEHIGTVYEALLGVDVRARDGHGLRLERGEKRRRAGAHYTSRALTRVVVERALSPLLAGEPSPDEILALRVCDPAMGSGAFLVEACRQLAGALVLAWQRGGSGPALAPGEDEGLCARRLVARHCLFGVDKDPLAVELTRVSLWLETWAREQPLTFLDRALRRGDSLLGLPLAEIDRVTLAPDPPGADDRRGSLRARGDVLVATIFEAAAPPRDGEPTRRRRRGRKSASVHERAGRLSPEEAERRASDVRARHAPFHWEVELPEVFEGRGGFDCVIGNPPWVSYAGRAAQPLSPDLCAFYFATSAAFSGYRNLQAIFVERAASLLRPGGRLGLVLPTSMSDLAGYEPSRRAHDAVCTCDEHLPDFGNAFDDVFQPSMGLLSTRRPARIVLERTGPWPLERRDLDADAIALLEHLRALPKLPPHLFGERGLQTIGDDVSRLHATSRPDGDLTVALREGSDIQPFLRRPPRLHCDPKAIRGRLRPPEDFLAVRLLIRQTARIPIVAPSDGLAFRNSLLAGFEDERHSAAFLLAYLGSTPIRWFHYFQHRDARQGIPQMKIGHLRALPDLPAGSPGREAIERFGAELGARNTGITAGEQAQLDDLVAAALGLDDACRTRLAAWATSLSG